MTPELQRRHFDYVLGPNQDGRLAVVPPGSVTPTIVTGLVLQMDSDAPFVLTGRAVRCNYSVGAGLGSLVLAGLQSVATAWTGPIRDYRSSGGAGNRRAYVPEALQSAYYGMFGNPKPIVPAVIYPAGSVLMLDLRYTGATEVDNLQFFFRGYKLYPKGTVPAYTYPAKCASQTFSYPVFVSQLGPTVLTGGMRRNQIFTVKQDADFVLRGGQSFMPSTNGDASRTLAEVSIVLKDADKHPYSNDFMPLDVLWGTGGIGESVPISTTSVAPFGTGPQSPGLFYPEIYVPKNQQLLYDLKRAEVIGGGNVPEDFTFNFIGGKVFDK